MKTTLYKRATTNVLWMWSIELDYDRLELISGTVKGAKTVTYVDVEENQSGRDIEAQGELQFNQRVALKLRAGYFVNKDDALNKRKFKASKPMRWNDGKDKINYANSIVQAKFNGFRCTSHYHDGVIKMYTYGRVELKLLDHIKQELYTLMSEGDVWDGEIYLHGVPLQTIRSWATEIKPQTSTLKYKIFDCANEGTFFERWPLFVNTQFVSSAINHSVTSMEEIQYFFNHYVSEGYEGIVVRNCDMPYSFTRNKSIIKYKPVMHVEFPIVGYTTETKNADKGCIKFILKLPNGKTFLSYERGKSKAQRRKDYRNGDSFLGKSATVEFHGYSIDGVPIPNPIIDNIGREYMGDI